MGHQAQVQQAPLYQPWHYGQYPPVRTWATKPTWRAVVKGMVSYGMLSFLGLIVVSAITLVYGTSIVSPEIVHHSYPLYVVVPLIISIVTISGTVLLAYYYLIVAAILASILWFFLSGCKTYVSELRMKAKTREHSAIFDVAGLLFAYLFMSTAIALLVMLMGGDVEGLGEDLELWEMLFVLANASVWEELVTRVLFVGLPLIMIHRISGGLRSKPHRYFVGGAFRMGRAEVALILASSVIFGFGHFAGGWGAWKILPTTIGGFAFGYIFLKHGLASAIVMHFGVDYMSMPASVFESTAMDVLTVLIVFSWICLGFVMSIYYISRMAEYVTGTRLLEPRPRAVPVMWTYPGWQAPQQWGRQDPAATPPGWTNTPPQNAPPPQVTPPSPTWGFVCPNCGNVEARWVEGRFQCLRCGYLS